VKFRNRVRSLRQRSNSEVHETDGEKFRWPLKPDSQTVSKDGILGILKSPLKLRTQRERQFFFIDEYDYVEALMEQVLND